MAKSPDYNEPNNASLENALATNEISNPNSKLINTSTVQTPQLAQPFEVVPTERKEEVKWEIEFQDVEDDDDEENLIQKLLERKTHRIEELVGFIHKIYDAKKTLLVWNSLKLTENSRDYPKLREQLYNCNHYVETHFNEILALFEFEPKPLINLSWLVKASEVLWENPSSPNDPLTKLERQYKIN